MNSPNINLSGTPAGPAERRPVRRHIWRWLTGSLAGLLALLAAWWAFAPRPLAVNVAQVTSGLFEQSIEEDGQLRLRSRYVVAAPMAGQLQRPGLQVGDSVQPNQVVAWLAPMASPMIDPRNQRVLHQRVGRDEAAQQAAAARVSQLQAALDQARLEAQRSAVLAQQKFIAAAALDLALTQERAAAQALEAGRADWLAAQFSLAESRAALSQTAASTAGSLKGLLPIASPSRGQVLKLHVSSAGPVAAGQALLEIGDVSALEAVIDVLSSDALHITPGAAVTLSLDMRQQPLAGRVRRIEPIAFTRVSALGIEEQRVNVLVDLLTTPAPDASELGDGFRVDARIVLSRIEQALRVPSAALVRDGQGWRVWAVQDGRVTPRQVILKDRNAEYGAIEPGALQAGDTVVMYPAQLREGQRVKPSP